MGIHSGKDLLFWFTKCLESGIVRKSYCFLQINASAKDLSAIDFPVSFLRTAQLAVVVELGGTPQLVNWAGRPLCCHTQLPSWPRSDRPIHQSRGPSTTCSPQTQWHQSTRPPSHLRLLCQPRVPDPDDISPTHCRNISLLLIT